MTGEQLVVWTRSAGKVTETIRLMGENPTALCIVLDPSHKELYPKELRSRVVTLGELERKLYGRLVG